MSLEEDFNYFQQCLINATSKIDNQYFKLSVAGAEKTIFRERVYCYELYHQLRCVLGDKFAYKLDGEVDKIAHPIIKNRKKPDFIVHVPGSMDKNLAVIEVKSVDTSKEEIKSDLEKLKDFLSIPQLYYRAIMLLYGIDNSKVHYARSEINNFNNDYPKRILLVWHKHPREPAKVV